MILLQQKTAGGGEPQMETNNHANLSLLENKEKHRSFFSES